MSVPADSNGDNPSGVEVIKANKILQAKVGTGPLDQATVERCQRVMDNNDVDFAPLAKEYLDELDRAIAKATSGGSESRDELVAAMTAPVMQLKANAATFRYDLIGSLANVMLSFLEAVSELDKDVITIVAAHHQTLNAIVANKMEGDGGVHGQQMEQELKGACQRYFAKKK